jgi:hypothetical protein
MLPVCDNSPSPCQSQITVFKTHRWYVCSVTHGYIEIFRLGEIKRIKLPFNMLLKITHCIFKTAFGQNPSGTSSKFPPNESFEILEKENRTAQGTRTDATLFYQKWPLRYHFIRNQILYTIKSKGSEKTYHRSSTCITN